MNLYIENNVIEKENNIKICCPYWQDCRHIQELEIEKQELKEHLEESEAKVEKLTGMLRVQLNDRFNKHSEQSKYVNPEKDKNTNTSEEEAKEARKVTEATETIDETNPQEIDKESVIIKQRKRTPHGRIIPENIPVIERNCEIEDEECRCPKCGKEYRKTSMYEESSEIDIEIKVVRKVYKRAKYAKCCECEGTSEIITAPKPPNIIYKSLYSTSLWVMFLILKYCAQIPLYRQTSKIWSHYGYEFKNSTIIGGFKKLYELFIPLYNAFIEKSRTEDHWHADETSWKVFIDKLGKKTFNWWIWIFASASVVVYTLDRTRSSSVPEKHFGKEVSGILNVDRYAAYKFLSSMLKLALCWYHTRRDFIKASKSFPQLKEWANNWVDMIGELSHINDLRVEAFIQNDSIFDIYQKSVEGKVETLFEICQEQLNDQSITEPEKKVLISFQKNREGLTVFVDNPLVPMHNNLSERGLRPFALGRNNFYGSRSEWSGELAAICMSIYSTAELYNINPQSYIEYYFDICAKHDSKPPEDLSPLLPWNLSEEIIQRYGLRNNKEVAS
jgi:transposase